MAKKPTKRAKPTQTEQQRTEALRLIRDKLDSQSMDERHVVGADGVEVFETPSDEGQWAPIVGREYLPHKLKPTTLSELVEQIRCSKTFLNEILDGRVNQDRAKDDFAHFYRTYVELDGTPYTPKTENWHYELTHLEERCRSIDPNMGTEGEQREAQSDRPTDLITFTVAIRDYAVCRSTLERAVQAGELGSYRRKGRGRHLVSKADIEKIYDRLPS